MDDLMDRVKLKDANSLVNKIKDAATKEDNGRQLLHAEIYSYAIDMGCEYSLKNKTYIHKPNNFNSQEGLQIIESHYNNSIKLLDRLGDGAEKYLCQFYIASLVESHIKLNRNSSNPMRALTNLSLGEMSANEQRLLLNNLYSSFANSLDTLDLYKTRDYPDFFSMTEDENGTFADVVVLNYINSNSGGSYVDYVTIDKLDKPDGRTLYDLFLTSMVLLQKNKGDVAGVAKYELMRINNFNNHCYREKKNDIVLRALDGFLEMCPDAVESIKAEALRAELMLYKYDKKSIVPDEGSLDKLVDRLLHIKSKFHDEQLLEPINSVLDNLNLHVLNCAAKSVYHSSEPIKIRVSNANVKNVVVSVKRTSYTPQEYQISKTLKDNEYYVMSDSSKQLTDTIPYDIFVPLNKDTFALSKSRYKYTVDDTLSIGNLGYGAYMLKIKDADDFLKEDSMTFVVSDIAVVTGVRDIISDSVNVYTVDYLSGKPQSDVLLYFDEKPICPQKTTIDGKVRVKRSEIDRSVKRDFNEPSSYYSHNCYVSLYPVKGDDGYGQSVEPQRYYDRLGWSGSVCSIMTDRAVYRPGQTVSFWGVGSYSDQDKDCVFADKTVVVTLVKQGSVINELRLTTNKFGKFNGEFNIDDDEDAIGMYYIKCKDDVSYCTFSVEDYKLPQYEVKIDRIEERYQIKDSVKISGNVRYYSGEPVLNAKVELGIDDEDYELTTDSLGRFSVYYVLDEDQLDKDEIQLDIEAVVTSPSGEVVELEKKITLYHDDVLIDCFSDKINLRYIDNWIVSSNTRSSNNKYFSNPVALSAELLFVSKKDGKVVSRQTKLLNGRTELDLPKLPIGCYDVFIIDTQSGDTLKKTNIVLYDSRSKVNPTESALWLSENRSVLIDENETFDYCIASNDSDAYVLYKFSDNDGNILKEEWINLKNELKTFTFSGREMFSKKRDKAYMVSCFIYKNGEYAYKSFYMYKKEENKQLTTKIKRLRDKIQTGSHQNWTIEVEGSKLPTSIAATMYDAALDVYEPLIWNPQFAHYYLYFKNYGSQFNSFNTKDKRSHYRAWLYPYGKSHQHGYSLPIWCITQSVHTPEKSIYTSADFKDGKVVYGYVRDISGNVIPYAKVSVEKSFVSVSADEKGYYEIHIPSKGCDLKFYDWGRYEPKIIFVDKSQRLDVVLNYSIGDELVVTGYGVQKKSDLTGSVACISESGSEFPSYGFGISQKNEIGQESKAAKSEHTGKRIRTNFSESAFFFPDIRTKNGKATIKFDAPESVSRWNIKIVSLTRDLHVGNDEFTVMTTMPFTVRPLLPRVFRVGDTCVVAATISSNEGKSVSGKTKFLFEDKATDKLLAEKTVDFSVSANSDQTVECKFVVPDDVENVRLTVTADGHKFSDGELHLIPVIKNKSRVIKANSTLVRKGETKELSVDADETNSVNLTFEYVPNSVWQAILAMPSIREPHSPDAISHTTALYVNSIVADIAANNPSIQKTLLKWKTDSLVMASTLLKDEELKSVSVDATPWKLEALDETEQRANVVNLMDDANAKKLVDESLYELKKFQRSDGGFSWFIDSNPSEFVTTYVVRYLTKLHQKNLLSADGAQMLKKALPNIDNYLMKNFNENKYRTGSLKASDFELIMMFTRMTTQNIVPIPKELKHTFDFVTQNTESHWHDLTLLGKATLVRVLVAQHKEDKAKEIVEAMRQTYTKSDTLGIYWKENQDYCSWYNNSIAVHSEAVRAFIETGMATEDEIAEMLLWLLRKRETTVWRSPVATVDAIDLLVSTSSLNTAGGIITLPNGETIRTADDCAFVKRTLSSKDLKNSIKVEGSKDCIGFASLYASYDADNSKITPASNYISIKKNTYRHEKRKGVDGKMEDGLTEVKDGDVINVGDKIEVVLTVENEQDLDFVMVKDDRPACLEPQKEVSGYKWRNGYAYYQVITDSGVRMFFDRLRKGKYNLSYSLFVQAEGTYSSGISSAECLYSPSFRGNSDCGVKIKSVSK